MTVLAASACSSGHHAAPSGTIVGVTVTEGGPLILVNGQPEGMPDGPVASADVKIARQPGGAVVAETLSDINGTFRVTVAPGNYKVTAITRKLYFVGPDQITVTDGQTTTVRLHSNLG